MNWKDRVRDALRLRGYDLVRHPLGPLLGRLSPTLVLDVGANSGHYGALVRRLGYRGRIVSFEPGAAAHARLAARAAKDPLWQTRQLALGDRESDRTLYLSRDDAASSFLRVHATTASAEPDTATVGEETVRSVRLDDLFGQIARADDRVFLKLDTQGSEAAILDGAAASLRRIDGVQMEVSFAPLYEGETTAGVLFERMRASGFGFVGLEHGFIDPATKRLLQADAYFERV